MLAHLMMFSDAAEAVKKLSDYGSEQSRGWRWRADLVIPGQRVVLARAEWDQSDPDNPVETKPEKLLPGYFVTVLLPEIDFTLKREPACWLIVDTVTGKVEHKSSRVAKAGATRGLVEPSPAGCTIEL